MKKIIIFFLINLIIFPASAQENLSLNLRKADLSQVIKLLAQQLRQNVIISPNIKGSATIHLKNVNVNNALNSLLQSYDLAALQNGNILYIAPYAELAQKKLALKKWQKAQHSFNTQATEYWNIRYANATDLAKLLMSVKPNFLSPLGLALADERTNLLIVQDEASKMPALHKLINKLDVASKQIMIAAKLVNIDKDSEQALGLQFANFQGSSFFRLAKFNIMDTSSLDIKLTALENSGHAELISNPKLFTTNQESASIEAGEEIPYQEMSESGGTITSFKKAVLSLQVVPKLLPDNMVLLQLKINQDRPSTKTVLGVPTISTRQIKTSVMVQAGQTLVLGGIYERDKTYSEQGIPYISRLPVIGWLFKQQFVRASKRELLIFVTPTIID